MILTNPKPINAIYACIRQGGTWNYKNNECMPKVVTSTSTIYTSTATNTVIYTSTSTSTIHTTIYTSTITSTSTATNTTNVLISDCINAGGNWNSNLGICQFTSPIVSFTSTSTSTQSSTSTSTSTSKVLTSSIFGIPMILIILILVVLMVVMMIK